MQSEWVRRRRSIRGLVFLCLLALPTAAAAQWTFVDVTAFAQIDFTHGYVTVSVSEPMMISGGVAAGDYDGDGYVDLFISQGDIGPNMLYRNLGALGKFREEGAQAGVANGPAMSCGPIFGDRDGDGWLDLLVGGVEGTPASVYSNQGNRTFADISAIAGVDNGFDQYSFAFGDIDGDLDLDMAIGHWTAGLSVWVNDGRNFDVSGTAGVALIQTFAFTPIFAEITGDGWLDLLVASDFGTSVVLFNNGDLTFTQNTASPITDENGMGASVGDYDNDGILDWFVTSIWDPDQIPEGNWGITGNRLYRGLGAGLFEDKTDVAGVRQGFWGWGSCFADFDNNGWLDIFHVNGFPHISATEFHEDPARLFMNNGDGTFNEQSVARGVADTGQGRGIICFDYDRDGDIDIFIANNSQPPKLYRNDGGNDNSHLSVRLAGQPPNTEGVGARVYVTVGGATQMRELRSGSNFSSSDPVEAHFGLGTATVVDVLRVEWPGGMTTILNNVPAGQHMTVAETVASPPGVPDGSTAGVAMTVDKLDPSGASLSVAWDTTHCGDATNYRILVGTGEQLPVAPVRTYGLTESVCGLGITSPFAWPGVPDPSSDPRGLIWWIVAASDGGSFEGSWGSDSSGAERMGPGPWGSSGRCGATSKDLGNSCGQ